MTFSLSENQEGKENKIGKLRSLWRFSRECLFFNSASRTVVSFFQPGYFLIHSTDPRSRPVVIIVCAHVVRPYVRPHFLKSSKTKQISSENNVHYWRDCGSGRVDQWWHFSFLLLRSSSWLFLTTSFYTLKRQRSFFFVRDIRTWNSWWDGLAALSDSESSVVFIRTYLHANGVPFEWCKRMLCQALKILKKEGCLLNFLTLLTRTLNRHPWSTRPAHSSSGFIYFAWFESEDGRTDKTCEFSDQYRTWLWERDICCDYLDLHPMIGSAHNSSHARHCLILRQMIVYHLMAYEQTHMLNLHQMINHSWRGKCLYLRHLIKPYIILKNMNKIYIIYCMQNLKIYKYNNACCF